MRRPLVLVLAAAALVAACGTATLDPAATERAVRTGVTERFAVAVEDVACPDDVRSAAGASFRCTVRAADDSSGTVVVTQQDDQGHVRVRAPFLRVAGVERLVSKGLRQQTGARLRLDCPDIVVLDAGGTFTCRARAGSRRARVRVVQQNARGRVRWQLVRS
jgi:hypothetical protein